MDGQPGLGLAAAGGLAAGAMAGASPFGGQPLPGDQPFGASPFGAQPLPGDQPFGAPAFGSQPLPGNQPFGVPPFSPDATIEDIMPLAAEDGTIEDIVPFEAEPDEISPIAAPPGTVQFGNIPPAIGEEEIEIEIDDLLEPIEATPIAPAPNAAPVPIEGRQAAMDHIKNTLAETGDLGAATEVVPELEISVSPAETAAPIDIDEMIQSVSPAESAAPVDLENLDLDEPLIDDIDDSDILEADNVEENAGQTLDTVAVDLDPDDLAPDFFDEVIPEPQAAPEPQPAPPLESALELVEPEPNLEELAQGDLAGPFWDEEAPASQAPEVESQPPDNLAAASMELNLDSLDDEDPGIEPEDLAVGLETNLEDLDQTVTVGEMFTEEAQMPAPPQAREPEQLVHPTAVPEMPANVFGSPAPEATLATPKSPGAMDADDLSSLADDINLDDLDSEL